MKAKKWKEYFFNYLLSSVLQSLRVSRAIWYCCWLFYNLHHQKNRGKTNGDSQKQKYSLIKSPFILVSASLPFWEQVSRVVARCSVWCHLFNVLHPEWLPAPGGRGRPQGGVLPCYHLPLCLSPAWGQPIPAKVALSPSHSTQFSYFCL